MLTPQINLSKEDFERMMRRASLEAQLEREAQRGDSGHALNTGAAFSSTVGQGANYGGRDRSDAGQQQR